MLNSIYEKPIVSIFNQRKIVNVFKFVYFNKNNPNSRISRAYMEVGSTQVHVYNCLKALEKNGLVTIKKEKRKKKQISLTKKGLKAFDLIIKLENVLKDGK